MGEVVVKDARIDRGKGRERRRRASNGDFVACVPCTPLLRLSLRKWGKRESVQSTRQPNRMRKVDAEHCGTRRSARLPASTDECEIACLVWNVSVYRINRVLYILSRKLFGAALSTTYSHDRIHVRRVRLR